jgi:hypothetical protein
MEKLSFTLGVASVLVVLMGIAITWVILKVKKLIIINEKLERYITETERNVHNRIDGTERNYSDVINEINGRLDRRIDDSYRSVDSIIEQNHREMVGLHNESISYTDSRIDKLINNPKFCLNKEKELLTD